MTQNMQQKPHSIQYSFAFNKIVLVLKESHYKIAKKEINEGVYMCEPAHAFMNVCARVSVCLCEIILTQQCLILCIPVVELGGALHSLVSAPLLSPELEQM